MLQDIPAKVEIVFAISTLKIVRRERQRSIAAAIVTSKISDNVKRIRRAAERKIYTIFCDERMILGQQIYFTGR